LPKPIRSSIDLTTLIEYYKSPQHIEDFVSPVTNENRGAEQSCRFGSFPKFLFVQVNRYEYDDFNQPKKLDVDVNVPDRLDLTDLRFKGPRPDEELLPAEIDIPTSGRKADKAPINQELVQQV
jgi:ubiquitin carboxyl-terminal hydrolase 5/13